MGRMGRVGRVGRARAPRSFRVRHTPIGDHLAMFVVMHSPITEIAVMNGAIARAWTYGATPFTIPASTLSISRLMRLLARIASLRAWFSFVTSSFLRPSAQASFAM